MVAHIETRNTALLPDDGMLQIMKALHLKLEVSPPMERPIHVRKLFSFVLERLFPEVEGPGVTLEQLSDNERLYLFVVCLYLQQSVSSVKIPLGVLSPVCEGSWKDGYEWVSRTFASCYNKFTAVHDLLSLEDSFSQFCLKKLAVRGRLAILLSNFTSSSCEGIKGYLYTMMMNELKEQGRRNKRLRSMVPTADDDPKMKLREMNMFVVELGQGSPPPVNAEELLDVMLPLLEDFLFTGKESYQRSLCNFLFRDQREDPFYAMPALKHKHELAKAASEEEQERIIKKLSNTRDKRISRMFDWLKGFVHRHEIEGQELLFLLEHRLGHQLDIRFAETRTPSHLR